MLVCEGHERVDGQQLERVFALETLIRDQRLERSDGRQQAHVAGTRRIALGFGPERAQHLSDEGFWRGRSVSRDPFANGHEALRRGRVLAGAPRMAASSLSASGMPACARWGLPPPFPPATAAISRTNASARTPRSLRSSVTTTSSVVLPSGNVVPRTPTPERSCSRSASPIACSSLTSPALTRRPTYRAPFAPSC